MPHAHPTSAPLRSGDGFRREFRREAPRAGGARDAGSKGGDRALRASNRSKTRGAQGEGEETAMLKGGLLWLIGIPIPIILLLWFLGVFH